MNALFRLAMWLTYSTRFARALWMALGRVRDGDQLRLAYKLDLTIGGEKTERITYDRTGETL